MRRVCRALFTFTAALFIVGLTTSDASAQAADKEYTISVGETLTFNARGVETVSIGMPEVADVKTSRNEQQIILTGKSPGLTTVNIFAEQGQKTLLIRVVQVNPKILAEEVRKVLGPRAGVDVRVVKGRVLIEGEVASETHKKKVKELAELYPNQVLNFTTFREAFVEGARVVALDIYFIQLSMTDRDDLGVNWGQFIGANYTFGSGDVPLYYGQQSSGGGGGGAGGGGGGGGTSGGGGSEAQLKSGVSPEQSGSMLSRPTALTGGGGLTSYWSVVGQVNAAIDLLVENGLVKTIQHGTIVTEAGQKARYTNGGTLLIESFGELIEKDYGLNVTVKPVVDYKNRVKLDIDMQFTELDQGNGVGEIPALTTASIQSVVNMEEGQSILVSSLDSTKKTSNETGFWLLSKVPILGWLFKKRNLLKRSLDNAMFITPRIYKPGGRSHTKLIKGVFKDLLDAGINPKDLPDVENKEEK